MSIFMRLHSFWFGLTLPIRAFRFIFSHPVLVFWSVLPIGLTLLLSGFLIKSLQEWAQQRLLILLTGWGLSPEGWLAWIALAFSQILLFLVAALSFSFVAGIAAAPFNDFLAENTERWASPKLSPVPQSRGWLRLVGLDVVKTIIATAAMIVAFALSFVPVIGFVAVGAIFLLMTFQYISYPQTRRGHGLGEGFRFIARHLFACLGFGLGFTFLFSIPLVSSLALPLAVVGGTLLVARAPGGSSPDLKGLLPLK